VSAIEEILRRRETAVARVRVHWAALWPGQPDATPDEETLAFFAVDIGPERVERAMDLAVARFGNSSEAAAYAVAVCKMDRRRYVGETVRSVWIAMLACPECESVGLMTVLYKGRPDLQCIECGAHPKLVRGRLDR
jgi:hypothetical protein